jgi:diadenosine tetraphosphate (Ap4A) HIT family hydrolase
MGHELSGDEEGMREIQTITGATLTAGCLGCAIASGPLVAYPGTIERSEYFHAHQDIEILLPGFVIVSTIRHIASVSEFSVDEEQAFAKVLARIRRAQRQSGVQRVYLFQNEDSPDHFHLWLFPVYDWMLVFGKGPALLSAAVEELKRGVHHHDRNEVFAMITLLKSALGNDGHG